MKYINPIPVFLILFLLMILSQKGAAQENNLDKKITVEFNYHTIKEALDIISQQEAIPFAYNNQKELNKRVAGIYNKISLSAVLDDIFKETTLRYKVIAGIITIYVDETESKSIPQKKTNTISGYVYDNSSGEALIGATIYDVTSHKGAVSNTYGFYSLTLENTNPVLSFSYVGYEKLVEDLTLNSNIRFDVRLKFGISQFDEVVIQGSKKDPLSTNIFSADIITSKELESLPITFGENDVIKAIQLKNGVVSLGEGSSGIFVQGGNTDQNLVLIDEANVYNHSHLFGLVSVFNPDAIKNVEFYKGEIPAQFGGKISSVVNCQMNDGNKQKLSLKGGIGTLTSHFSVEGPIQKDKASFLFAIRRSIRDIFQNPSNEVTYVPQFYDINSKINWNVGEKNRFYLSFYNGKDEIKTDNDYSSTWGNSTLTARWTNTLSSKLFLTFSGVYSKYYNNLEFIDSKKNYQWLTGVEDVTGKLNLSWYISTNNTVKVGVESTYHQYVPGENGNSSQSLFRVNALEHAAYVQQDINFTKWLGANYGFRFSAFQNTGGADWVPLVITCNISI